MCPEHRPNLSTLAHAWTGLFRQIAHLYRYSNHHRWAIRKSNTYAQIRPFLKLGNSQLAPKLKQNIWDNPIPNMSYWWCERAFWRVSHMHFQRITHPCTPAGTTAPGRLLRTVSRDVAWKLRSDVSWASLAVCHKETWICVLSCFQKFQTCFFLGHFGDLSNYINSRKINVFFAWRWEYNETPACQHTSRFLIFLFFDMCVLCSTGHGLGTRGTPPISGV